MAYGGLRGAVGFSLVDMIDDEKVPLKNMFVTTTLMVVMFTIFFQVYRSREEIVITHCLFTIYFSRA